MSSRSRTIEHPSGLEIKTPLLVPSFSSKGFNMRRNGKSEIWEQMLFCTEFLTESMLVSAFDLHYGHVPKASEFVCTEVTFIDSGGYETSQVYDLSGVIRTPGNTKKISSWSEETLMRTLDEWPTQYPAIIVNYDHGRHRKSLEEQIESAQKLFGTHKDKLNDFLIKPETKDSHYIDLGIVVSKIYALTPFDIIGLTEKELGNSILRRMQNIYKLRKELDKAGLNKPIHIFGSLDPVTSILYFLAGAEIFDGLTWLRFSYHQGMAIYSHNYCVFNDELGIHIQDKQLAAKSLMGNIYFLSNMKHAMIDFHTSNKFEEFGRLGYPNLGKEFERHYHTFQSSLKGE